MSLKLWSTDINALRLWSTEINQAYLWSTEVFSVNNWLLNNLVSYYKADTSWSFPDAHWTNDMTLVWPTFTTWKINGGYNFDGGDYCYINKNETYSAWSLACWVKYTENLANGFINLWRYNWGAWNQVFRITGRGTVIASVWLAWSEITANAWINKNDWLWHHVWCSWDSNWDWKIRLYIDWVLLATSTWVKVNDFIPWTGADYRNIGGYSVDNNTSNPQWKYTWDIDECAIWTRALAGEDFTNLYNSWAWLPYSNFTS